MLSPQVARLGVPYSLMHRRGDPSTMTLPENTAYADVAAEVGFELQEQAEQALAAGIESWRMLLDPGADCFRIDVPGLQKTRTIQFPRGSRCSRAGAGRRIESWRMLHRLELKRLQFAEPQAAAFGARRGIESWRMLLDPSALAKRKHL